MLQIKEICKQYKTGPLVQQALDHVSLNLRDNEFVAILGPSGSGKTTLLNIIGGLDRYDSGDLIINGISTRKYTDRDWDSYRNHTIGFIFQSYNLIPHQTILANVELALTISGISKSERTARAKAALEEVGLAEHMHKKPNQLSGGQMQRVAIARALINNPDILLADEPTGALDSDTSVQVMDLLKQVAKDRLVVMVTHNPELAEQYANRIVNLRDGKITSDSNPYLIDEEGLLPPTHKNMGRSSMSFLTALSLSFNNLKTKLARTLLTAFAGSIGIIGIALILSLSNGVNEYIRAIEEDTLSEYPLEIDSSGFDLSSLMALNESSLVSTSSDEEEEEESDGIHVIELVSSIVSTVSSNDLDALMEYFESGESGIEEYVNAIEYDFDVTPQIYTCDEDSYRQVHPDSSLSSLGLGSSSTSSSLMSSYMSTDVFYELPSETSLYVDQYDVVAGRWPESYDEVVLVLTSSGSISDFMLYTMGLRDSVELEEMIEAFANEEDYDVNFEEMEYSYDDILGITFKLVNSYEYYEYDEEYSLWRDKTDDEEYMLDLVSNGVDITIVGIVMPSEDANAYMLSTGLGYTPELTEYVAAQAEESEIVQDQLANPDINVLTGEEFGSDEDSFSMDSMITIDEEALEDLFSFDEDAFDLSSIDLSSLDLSSLDLSSAFSSATDSLDLGSSLDLSSISIDLPEMDTISMDDLTDSISISLSSEEMSEIAASVLAGYTEYAASNPEADYSNLLQDFITYLKSDDAWDVLEEHIIEIIMANESSFTVDTEQLEALVTEVMYGYMVYAAANGYTVTDTSEMYDYLLEYLSTDDAQTILANYASSLFPDLDTIEITDEQISSLAADLASGYLTYASANSLTDPTTIGESFLNYLGSDSGQEIISSALMSAVDTSALESQISASITSYMETVMTAYGTALSSALETQITAAMTQMMTQLSASMTTALEDAFTVMMEEMMEEMTSSITDAIADAFDIDADALAEAFQIEMTEDDLMELMTSLSSSSSATYESNLANLGYVDFSSPSSIYIYPKDFDSKEVVVDILDEYNERMQEIDEDKVITYTDYVGTMMSSVTQIINMISYVLIAFVAISLVVSSIMIGVITYISVLERKKEIGILRAIGASKRNISQVFNAETFIIGLISGCLGIGLSRLLIFPINWIIQYVSGADDVKAVLPITAALALIALSVILTMIGGLIPSKKAAKSDPVTALRTE